MPTPTRRPTLQTQRTSISPKELMLDGHGVSDHSTPLFTADQVPSTVSTFETNRVPNLSAPDTAAGEPWIQIPPEHPFVSHTISTESTAGESSEPSSQQRPGPQTHTATPQQQHQALPRPVDTPSDSGTYSCPYQDCHLRFDTQVELKNHKKGHRPSSSGGASVVVRSSQAGPHRCDRINPGTGKPCNSIFSRPYDLTRHEDAIHNPCKEKFLCHSCARPFTRHDALTRHQRARHRG
ncbi:uncharacterized protein PV07_12623 [Cladophialophora immunda]|uniref:C2H2-type domain-containing protein n=1 Tax=Cladophialophora immunda TaxID=569365 RepID=A0A0D1Z2Y8_9EURO|nr:uncharacterized protein PV07_12623 [Cladophialophora immunda]KIW21971.1 hypothetical protein PV07_12623 [Cladophialophora immunda]